MLRTAAVALVLFCVAVSRARKADSERNFEMGIKGKIEIRP